MNLQSLLLSSDDKTTRVLRRVLGGLEISLEHCTDVDAATRQLTRHRFEAVILDSENERANARMLAGVRSAPCNKHAVVVAVVDRRSDQWQGLTKDADFVLYKPVAFEQAQRSFRAARYLMKCECRRTARVTVQFPVSFLSADKKSEQRGITSDISEGGMAAVRFSRLSKMSSPTRLRFTLPGTDHVVECTAELAWENAQSEAGFRFVDLSPEDREHLRQWLSPYYFDYHVPGGAITQAAQPEFAPATE
jgi:CheY-like chemotaxis protein